MIKVCGHRILVKPFNLEDTDPVYKQARAAGLELAFEHNPRQKESVDIGTVEQIGPTAWKDFNSEPWCKNGDTVVYAKYAGKKVIDPDTKEEYTVLNDEDIVAIVGESK